MHAAITSPGYFEPYSHPLSRWVGEPLNHRTHLHADTTDLSLPWILTDFAAYHRS